MADAVRNGVSTLESRRDREREEGSAGDITRSLLRHVGDVVESCRAAALFIYIDAVDDAVDLSLPPLNVPVFYVTKTPAEEKPSGGIHYLRVPNVPLTRIGQVKIAVFLASAKGLIQHGERVVFLAGPAAAKTLDTLMVSEVGHEYSVLSSRADLTPSTTQVLPEVIERVMDIAVELGSEGREGRALGAIFVIGDTERVMPLTRQLVLNPFKGYPPSERNILDYSLEETIKELATLDGAFIIDADGVVQACGAYIRTASQQDVELPRGLGARHQAAAAITAVTDSSAVTVSESTGSIMVFRRGRILMEIQKPRSTADKSKLHRIKHHTPDTHNCT